MDLDVVGILIGLFGGLSLFLYGMGQMTDALKQATGKGLRNVLARLTTNRFSGVFSGAFVTTLTQSSSVTTVLLVGFVSAGLMTLQQTVGVIMGANIGSTVTAQIIAFDISRYSLLILAVGFAVSALSRDKRISQYGLMVMGLGMVFFGMGLMSQSTYPLRSYPPFIDLMGKMDNPALGILVGAVFTALVQSSAATTGILIVLISQGVITLEAGIVLAFGANIGTCVTALLASVGKPRQALQVALVHILFNVIGVLIWIPLIGYLAEFVRAISPTYPDLPTAERIAREAPRELANAHTFFNVANTILLIGFVGPLSRLVQRLAPAPPRLEPKLIQPKFIDPVYLGTPDLALQQIRHEIGRIGRRVVDMMEAAPLIVMHGRPDRMEVIVTMAGELEQLYDHIVAYSRELGGKEISESQSHSLQTLLEIGNYLMSTADIVETSFVSMSEEVRENRLEVSPGTRLKLQQLFEAVSLAMRLSLKALEEEKLEEARRVIEMKETVDELANQTIDRLGERLLANEPNRIILFRIQNEIVNQTKRIYYLAKRIAKAILSEEANHMSQFQRNTGGEKK
ncbi:MAG: Na/Pi cotransporter family protein [Candidatus Omnitrophica bacterium]|nr:Na/Pi cotransporter family protein [Candidatus Omnitrophota bacterium]